MSKQISKKAHLIIREGAEQKSEFSVNGFEIGRPTESYDVHPGDKWEQYYEIRFPAHSMTLHWSEKNNHYTVTAYGPAVTQPSGLAIRFDGIDLHSLKIDSSPVDLHEPTIS